MSGGSYCAVLPGITVPLMMSANSSFQLLSMVYTEEQGAACLTWALLALQITRLKANYEEEFLSYLTEPQDAIQIAATFRILSTHAENEEYLTETEPEWIEVCSPLAAYKASPTTMCCSFTDHKLASDI